MSELLKIALVGNPNTGKTSLFNRLTGLNQKVGNYPGITVDKKIGTCKLSTSQKASIIDLPGTYSLNASSIDEDIAVKVLSDVANKNYPDVVIVVADVENLKRNLLLFTQIKDLGLPTVLAINMQDQMKNRGISIDIDSLAKDLKTNIVLISTKKNTGIDDLKKAVIDYRALSLDPCFMNSDGILDKQKSSSLNQKHRETIKRYQFLTNALNKSYTVNRDKATDLRAKLDRVLTHPIFGYLIFFAILFFIFQGLFYWTEGPMEFIDTSFASLGEWVKNNFQKGIATNLISEGIIPGVGGVLIFIPQIAFLFMVLSILEESGYMSRVVFLMDRIMKRFGMSGKSVVPLISGTACAIPAIMAARNIESWKERLITILVTPFTTCAARIPVYAIIISLVIPNETIVGGLFNLQGLTLMLLYLIGFVSAIIAAAILDKVLKIKSRSYFVIEMPDYKLPLLKNVLIHVFEKTKAFVFGAGKIILAISILLWLLASYGPTKNFKNAEEIVKTEFVHLNQEELDAKIATFKLENSYIGILGKTIEPVIRPLGYDWKIGIALITSFAAREVFVGTLATIYSVGSEEEISIKNKMKKEVDTVSGRPIYNFASGISLLLFYAFAMQCMSTLAIVKRETNSWKWPIIQLAAMTTIAYISALIAYQFLK